MKSRMTKFAILLIVICNVGCDQISKTIVRKELRYYDSSKIFIDNITLTKVENSGAFLSMGSVLPQFLKFALLIVLPAIVLAFVIGGGIGNLYDRIIFGSVTDFLHIDFVVFQTGIFNLADVSIMIGMGMIVAATYINRRPVTETL
jgi:signal peptidase II